MHKWEINHLDKRKSNGASPISCKWIFYFNEISINELRLYTEWVLNTSQNSNAICFQAGSDLLLTNVTTQDAGTYTCLISTSSPDSSALLNDSADIYESMDDIYVEAMKIKVIIRTVPGPVSRLSLRISTILGVLMWEFKKNMSGGYPLKSFTAEFRQTAKNNETSREWERLDPINIAPNVVKFLFFFF